MMDDPTLRAWFEEGKNIPDPQRQYVYFTDGLRAAEAYHPWAWAGIGLVWAKRGNLPGAIDAFEKAIALKQDFPEAKTALDGARNQLDRAINSRAGFSIEPPETPPASPAKVSPKTKATTKKTQKGHLKVPPTTDEQKSPPRPSSSPEMIVGGTEDAQAWHVAGLKLEDGIAMLHYFEAGLEKGPAFAAWAWNGIGVARQHQRDLVGAEEAFKKAIAINSTRPRFWFNLAGNYVLQQNHPEAAKAFERVVQLEPKMIPAWYCLAKAREASGDMPGTVAAYRKLTELDPIKAIAWETLGVYQVTSGEILDAIMSFEQALRLDPNQPSTWANLGNAKNYIGDHTGAVDACEMAVRMNPQFVEGWFNLGITWSNAEEHARATIAFIVAVKIKPEFGLGWFHLGKETWTQGHSDIALYCYEQAAKCGTSEGKEEAARLRSQGVTPIEPAFLQRSVEEFTGPSLSLVFPAGPEHLQEVMNSIQYGFADNFDRIMHGIPVDASILSPPPTSTDKKREVAGSETKPPSSPLPVKPRVGKIRSEKVPQKPQSQDRDALIAKGIQYAQQRNYTGARDIFEQAVTLDPSDIDSWIHLGYVRGQIGDLRGSEEACDKALAMDPKNLKAWILIGIARRSLNNLEGARVAHERAVALGPNISTAWDELGVTRCKLGDKDGAISAHKKAIALEPNEFSWIHFGNTYNEFGDFLHAVKAFEKALALAPEDFAAWNNLGMALKKLGDDTGAIAALEEAVARNPSLSDAWGSIGYLYMRNRNYPKAEDALEQAIKIDSSWAPHWSNLGIARDALGNRQGAVQAFIRCVALNPQFADGWVNLGNSLEKSGEAAEALYCWEQAERLGDPQAGQYVKESKQKGIISKKPSFLT